MSSSSTASQPSTSQAVTVVISVRGWDSLTLTVDADGRLQSDGDASWFRTGFSVYSERLGEKVTFEQDPLEWARGLPGIYDGSPGVRGVQARVISELPDGSHTPDPPVSSEVDEGPQASSAPGRRFPWKGAGAAAGVALACAAVALTVGVLGSSAPSKPEASRAQVRQATPPHATLLASNRPVPPLHLPHPRGEIRQLFVIKGVHHHLTRRRPHRAAQRQPLPPDGTALLERAFAAAQSIAADNGGRFMTGAYSYSGFLGALQQALPHFHVQTIDTQAALEGQTLSPSSVWVIEIDSGAVQLTLVDADRQGKTHVLLGYPKGDPQLS